MNSQKLLFSMLVVSLVMVSFALASPYFMIGQDQWEDALHENTIRGMDANEWDDYLAAWQDPNEGEPYPYTDFYPPQLYVYDPPPTPSCDPDCIGDFYQDGTINFRDFSVFAARWLSTCPQYSYPKAPGMVMAWNPPQIEEGTSASAWVFTYGEDPDLTSTTVEIEVDPSSNITIVSFGFKDINGKRRAWWWDCGSGKPVDGRTKLIITTDNSGASTASPTTSNYLSENLFDITQVQSVIADEQNTWRSGRAVPPPGQNVAKAWNYWYNLLVTPLPKPKPPTYFKWRQPAQYIGNQGNYWGWDEVSVDHDQPLLADDWVCTDDRPITDIHWWGSFPNKDANEPGWIEPVLPPIPPAGFHIGIWTDVPVPPGNQDLTVFSHPNEVVWEHYCSSYDSNFVGFDRDPNDPEHPVRDSCFKFSCDLEPADYFHQDPNDPNGCRIYWLSIAAVYDPNLPAPDYEWGWKTRPHFCHDDAVRITGIVGGGWPPTLGSEWDNGTPVEYPEWFSWDLSFELTTDQNEPNCCPCP